MQITTRLLLLLSALVSLSLARVVRVQLHQFPSKDSIQNYALANSGREKKFTNLGITNLRSMRYYGVVTIGTPPQTFKLCINSGGSEFWVISSRCQNVSCFFHRKFNHDLSSTYKPTGREFIKRYPHGYNFSTVLAHDTVTVAGITVKNQIFGEAVKVTDSVLINDEMDGILGMGGSPSVFTSVFFNMISQGLISKPIFSYYLSSKKNTDGSFGGEVLLGGSDPKLYHGSLNYISLWRENFWIIPVHSITMEDTRYCRGGCRALVDTGNTDISGPVDEIKQINEQLGAILSGNMYVVPCDSVPVLPTITFTMGGHHFLLTAKDYIMKQTDSKGEMVCVSGFQPWERNMWILGHSFLGAYYAEFDAGNKRVGFAPSK